jgi:hypothetical protein
MNHHPPIPNMTVAGTDNQRQPYYNSFGQVLQPAQKGSNTGTGRVGIVVVLLNDERVADMKLVFNQQSVLHILGKQGAASGKKASGYNHGVIHA